MRILRHSPATLRGIAIGLWILTGLVFLADALLPGIGRLPTLAPWLLAASVAWTAVIPQRESAIIHDSTSRSERTPRPQPSRALLLIGFAFALAISFTIVRDGTNRSFLFGALTAGAALMLWFPKKNPA
ncbi:MAG: hypothetical protein G01um1014106_501 [Parcubacteria group bacterium Gr01-1014_106]|nr:MAG: hypothetical protein G01um1014106_501 [Parcubacteria group bacterium Gr01-1014_106]